MPEPTLDGLQSQIDALNETLNELADRSTKLSAALDSERSERASTAPPVGAVLAFAGGTVPQRYLLCNGSPAKKSDYPELFAAIGTAHGNGVDDKGDKVPDHDFNLPDFRGYFLRGADGDGLRDKDVAYRSPARYGGNGSGGVGSVQSSEFTRHDHSFHDPGHAHAIDSLTLNTGGPQVGGGSAHWWHSGFSTAPSGTNIAFAPQGGSETRPVNVYVHFIIRAS